MTQPHPAPPVPRRRWTPLIWLAVLVAWPVLELWVMWFVMGQIGFWWSMLLMLVTAVLGGWLMAREGGKSRKAVHEMRAAGRRPEGQLLDAILILVGGVLLVLPGFVGDVFGLLALLPWTRPILRRAGSDLIDARLRARGVDVTRLRVSADRGTIISGETVSDQGMAEPPANRNRDDEIVIKGEIEP